MSINVFFACSGHTDQRPYVAGTVVGIVVGAIGSVAVVCLVVVIIYRR